MIATALEYCARDAVMPLWAFLVCMLAMLAVGLVIGAAVEARWWRSR